MKHKILASSLKMIDPHILRHCSGDFYRSKMTPIVFQTRSFCRYWFDQRLRFELDLSRLASSQKEKEKLSFSSFRLWQNANFHAKARLIRLKVCQCLIHWHSPDNPSRRSLSLSLPCTEYRRRATVLCSQERDTNERWSETLSFRSYQHRCMNQWQASASFSMEKILISQSWNCSACVTTETSLAVSSSLSLPLSRFIIIITESLA